MAEPLRIVFMGTPDLAASVLRRVLEWEEGEVIAAYCQPDRPAGRGLELKAPPVKTLALEHGIPVFQPLHFKSDIDVMLLESLAPDYLLVAAYGLILPQKVLDIPSRMALNVHTSLLPKYRGAAPIQRAVMNGDAETGVSIMAMDAGLDTGPVVLQETLPIAASDTAGIMHDKLAELGGELLIRALEGLEEGRLQSSPQNEAEASYAAKLGKNDGAIDFSQDASRIDAIVRGVSPWPGAFANLVRDGEKPLRVAFVAGSPLNAPAADTRPDTPTGTILGLTDGSTAVRCASGVYGITTLKPAGKAAMDAAAFANGYLRGHENARFCLPE
ncbi:methionyl-tRNA formyltransferase [Desulfovibrio sp. OttesenSCG-928-I05]|nr:methionyl-tRNA formyltransferase [Desulfovibrio sp. OttesenSCG-928-I05]